MTPCYFTFADRATAEAVMLPFVEDRDRAEPPARVGRLMGITYEPIEVLRFPAVRDEMGNEIVAERIAAGFHVNTLVPDGVGRPAGLAPYEVVPVTPTRRIAP